MKSELDVTYSRYMKCTSKWIHEYLEYIDKSCSLSPISLVTLLCVYYLGYIYLMCIQWDIYMYLGYTTISLTSLPILLTHLYVFDVISMCMRYMSISFAFLPILLISLTIMCIWYKNLGVSFIIYGWKLLINI